MKLASFLRASIPTTLLALAVTLAGTTPVSATATPTHSSGPHVASASGVTAGGWPSYLAGPKHTSYNAAETTITPANVGQLRQKWHWKADVATIAGQPGPSLSASPTVADGAIYVGSGNGYFYKLDETTGAVLHKVFLGYAPKLTCPNPRGIVSTATVAVDPTTGQDFVYVASSDGYLYALSASDLTVMWRSLVDLPSSTVNDYFNWSSPTVANGKIYIGSSSECDRPLTRGAVVGFDQATGNEFGRYFTVPSGYLGGGVWTSVAVADDGSIYASTGTQPKGTNFFDAVSIVRLDGKTLAKLGGFTVPSGESVRDGDFGGSPTIFGSLVGACNKNGYFYALDRLTMALVWRLQVGAPNTGVGVQCAAAAVYDGVSLYIAGDPTTINGVAYRGSISRLDPATGTPVWQLGLPNSVLGTPTMDGAGVIAVGTYDTTATPNAVYLVNAATGQNLRTLTTGGHNFAQSVFADGYIFTANLNAGIRAYHLP
jgi:polyvinyl alcohol dehydrogenase (cytochrome)